MRPDSTNGAIRLWKRTVSLLRLLPVLGAVLLWAYAFAIRPWHLKWGATDEEASKPLLGDELVPDPVIESTRAITVHAPERRVVEEVWSWLEQITPVRPPEDVHGFYSYTWLDAVSSTPAIADIDRCHPEWQHRVFSEIVRLLPATKFKVAALEPRRVKVSIGWGTFAVEPIDESSARVILRSRVLPRAFILEREGGLHNRLFYHPLLGEFPHFLIERSMLKGIKERAESKDC